MARDKKKESEDFFSENFVQEVSPEEVKPVPNKSQIKVRVYDFVKGMIRAVDLGGSMYIIEITKDTVNLKVGDSFFI
jgi:hypothetical protein